MESKKAAILIPGRSGMESTTIVSGDIVRWISCSSVLMATSWLQQSLLKGEMLVIIPVTEISCS